MTKQMKMTQAQQVKFNKGIAAFDQFQLALNADDVFTVSARAIIKTAANSFEKKGFEASALAMAIEHGASSPMVMRLRAKLAKVETDKAKQNWTITFGYDRSGKDRVLNAAHLQRAVSKKGAVTKKLAGKDTPIKGVKDLTALIAYALDNYGAEACVAELTNQIKQIAHTTKA